MLMAIASAIVLALLWLRSNVAICFLALCGGSVLLASSGENLSLIASSVTSGIDGSTNIAKIALLLVPLITCAFITRRQAPKSLFAISFVVAISTALLTLLFIEPLLSEDLQNQVIETETWALLEQYREFIVGVGLVVSIVLISMTIRRPHDKHHKKKH